MIINLETAIELLKLVRDEIDMYSHRYSGKACDTCKDEYGQQIINGLEYPHALIQDFLESANIQTGVIHDL